MRGARAASPGHAWASFRSRAKRTGRRKSRTTRSPRRATHDLNALGRRGVEIVGRFAGVRDATAQFSGSLPNVCALADLKLGRLLDAFDTWARRTGTDAGPPQRFAPTRLPARPALSARVGAGGIETIVWATGLRPALSFLDGGVLDRRGRPVHEGGVTAAPGLYLMGLPIARDMEGRVLSEILDDTFTRGRPLSVIPSYEGLAVTPLAEPADSEPPPLPDEG